MGQYGLKTKVMVVSKQESVAQLEIKLDKKQLEQVDKKLFILYRQSQMMEDMKNALTNNKFRYVIQKCLVKCYIFATLLYGAETWTISKSSEIRIRSFEMWVHRRMLKISWKEMKTNMEVLSLVGPNKSIVSIIKERKIRYCGHLLRHDSLQKELLEGKVEGKRGRGRPRKRWFDNIREWTGKSFVECKRLAQKRDDWRKMIVDLLKADGTP